jgi:hypothetical protein
MFDRAWCKFVPTGRVRVVAVNAGSTGDSRFIGDFVDSTAALSIINEHNRNSGGSQLDIYFAFNRDGEIS